MMALQRALRATTLLKPNWTPPSSPSVGTKLTHSLCLIRAWSSTVKIQEDLFFHINLSDYFEHRELAEKKLRDALASPSRFQSIDEREDRTDINYYSSGKYISRYRGAYLQKNPTDLSVYYQLFTHVRPRTVLEMGTCDGSSAIWYDDTAKTLDLDCHVYSVDCDPALLDEGLKRRKPDTVDFITGDSKKIEDVFPPAMLEPLAHPWLVIEDCHVNTVGIIEYLHQFMKVGDYLVVEDTSLALPNEDISNEDCELEGNWGEPKMNKLKKLLRNPIGQNFKVDSFLTDFYGYNCTWHWHGFLRKCS